jgi:transmembrane protein 70, mitochondrial
MLNSQVKRIKMFTLTTSVIGLSLQPVLITQFLEKYGFGLTTLMFLSTAVFTVVTPLLIHYLAKKYILELSYDKKTGLYTATTYTFFLKKFEVSY